MPLRVRAMLSQVIESQIAGGMRNQLFGWQRDRPPSVSGAAMVEIAGLVGRGAAGQHAAHAVACTAGPFLFGFF